MILSAQRTLHFFASSEKAKRELGWTPKHTFVDDVAALVADYQKLGRQVCMVLYIYLFRVMHA